MYSNVYKGIHLTFEEQINLLNLKFKFKKWKKNFIYMTLKVILLTNKIALTVVIMEYLVFKINADFPGGAIKKALKQLCKYKTDEEAQKLGFKNFQIIEKLKI